MPEIETHTADPSGSSPGAILKRCRTYHKISLEEAEEATKIGASYLKALEDERINQFASLAYLKGFLRIYAAFLGLDPDDMIRLYEKLYTSKSRAEDRKASLVEPGRQAPRRKFPLQKLALPAALLVLILITAAIVNRPPSPSSRQRQAVSPTPSTAVQAVQPPRSSSRQNRPANPVDNTPLEQAQDNSRPPPQSGIQKSPAESARGIIVRLKVTQNGTVTVTIDAAKSQGYELAVGDSIEWKADRTVTLELSNAGGVEAELNGQQLKPLGPSGKPAIVVIDAEGIRP